MRPLTKESLIALGVIVVLVASAIVFVYLPQGRELDKQRTTTASVQTAIDADMRRAAGMPSLLRQVEEMRSQYKDWHRRLPRHRELGGFLGEIAGNLAEEQLLDPEIVPGNPAAEELYHTLPIVMRCRGSYLRVASFLKRINSMQRLTRVHTLKIEREPAKEDLKIEMQLNIYFTQT